jgi:osmotically-inducible protein OsmY
LNGAVQSSAVAQKAVGIANSVDGVTSVKSNLTVRR